MAGILPSAMLFASSAATELDPHAARGCTITRAATSTIQKILGGVNRAGFFCAGEIGPIGGKNFLHGQTASLALFRPANV